MNDSEPGKSRILLSKYTWSTRFNELTQQVLYILLANTPQADAINETFCVRNHLFSFTQLQTNKYYVRNYSINSFTGASEAPVNVVVVY